MDEALDTTLDLASRGDQSAWRAIVDRYAPRVYGLLKSQCGDAELAEEIAQSVFCTVAAKLTGNTGYVEQGKFEAWIFRIAVNRLRDDIRRRRRQATAVEQSALDERAAPSRNGFVPRDDDEHVALRGAIERLSAADRQIIEYRYIGGLSFKQMAELLDEPLGTVLARQHRALRKLRDLLEHSPEDQTTPRPARKAGTS
ncbi:MAG: RNA polymerase sigma factor [Phycisphaerales bacterium]|nr:RNA polymerase sigma factor [Phycisphaerales bacterium]